MTGNVRARRQFNAKSSVGQLFQAANNANHLFETIEDNASETYVYLVAVLALHRNLALGSIGDDRHSGPSSEGHILPHNARDVEHTAVYFQIMKNSQILNWSRIKAMFMQSTTQSRQLWCLH